MLSFDGEILDLSELDRWVGSRWQVPCPTAAFVTLRTCCHNTAGVMPLSDLLDRYSNTLQNKKELIASCEGFRWREQSCWVWSC